jgi:hypothetical protein
MRSTIILAVWALCLSAAQAQVKGQASTRAGALSPPQSQVQVTATNQVHRSLKSPARTYSGVAVQAAKSRNPLQLINPLAPARYGSGEANLVLNPATLQGEGINLFSVAFW